VCACAAIALIGALTACNSVDSGTSGANLSPNYERLASEAKKTALKDVAIKLQAVPTNATLSTSSGTILHSTGATTINDSTYKLVDPEGYTANGLLTDGTSTLMSTLAQGFTRNYDYVCAYPHSYFVNTVPYVAS